jgi:hypothetical protein
VCSVLLSVEMCVLCYCLQKCVLCYCPVLTTSPCLPAIHITVNYKLLLRWLWQHYLTPNKITAVRAEGPVVTGDRWPSSVSRSCVPSASHDLTALSRTAVSACKCMQLIGMLDFHSSTYPTWHASLGNRTPTFRRNLLPSSLKWWRSSMKDITLLQTIRSDCPVTGTVNYTAAIDRR